MRRIAAALLLAAGCSEQPAAREAATAPSATPAAAVAASKAGVGAVTARAGGLRADVSALDAGVSGLNTRVTDLGTVVELPADTLFEFDRADLTEQASANLLKAAELIRRTGGSGAIAITGHTDAKGEEAYNQRLSEARAQAVADWMKQQVGVRQRGFAVVGKGESAPVAPNTRPDGADDPAGRARNRRVELLIPNG